MIREDLGNLTEDREHRQNLWMTNFINYNGPNPKSAFAQHASENVQCTIRPLRLSAGASPNAYSEINSSFVQNFTYAGLIEAPWETT